MYSRPSRCAVIGHATTCQAPQGDVVYFKPVPGALVFGICAILIVACLVWMGMLLHKGVKFEEA